MAKNPEEYLKKDPIGRTTTRVPNPSTGEETVLEEVTGEGTGMTAEEPTPVNKPDSPTTPEPTHENPEGGFDPTVDPPEEVTPEGDGPAKS